MRNDVFRDAAKINSIRVPGSFGLSGTPEYVSSNDEVRRKLLRKFTKLVMGVPGDDLPPSPSERGAEILRITSAISHYYPFPTRAKPSDQGGVSLDQMQPISFRALDDIEKWIKDVDAIHGSVFWILDNHRGKLEEYLLHFQSGQNTSAFEVTLPEDVKSYLSPGARRDIEQSIKRAESLKGNIAPYLFEGFVLALKEANNLGLELSNKLNEYKTHKKQMPSKSLFLTTILFASLAFACSVVIPMFLDRFPSIFWKWIPVSFYLYAIILLVVKVVYL